MTTVPRETLQQQYIRQLKLAVSNILHMLMENAGKSGKSPIVTGSIRGEIAQGDDALRRLGNTPNVRADVRTAWAALKALWNDGDGSWTKSRDKADELNHHLQNTD